MKPTIKTLHEDAIKFLKGLESDDLRRALQLNRQFKNIDLEKSGYDDTQHAYRELVLNKTELSLSEAIMVLSNDYFQMHARTTLYDDETQIEATCRHAKVAYCEAVLQTATNIFKEMWQEWMRGKGTVDEIVETLSDRTAQI